MNQLPSGADGSQPSATAERGRPGTPVDAQAEAPVSAAVARLLRDLDWSEKLAQLQGQWIRPDDGAVVAPEMDSALPVDEFSDFARHGLGHLTRVYGTAPIPPAEGLAALIGYQRWILANTRNPIGLVAHEECLTGLAAWTATTYPTPLAWAASFDPDLVERMGREIGATMAALGVHQGLAPVLDVVRDVRWGRVEETMGEDPYVVGSLGAAYVRGVQSAGVVATLKHYLAYSASQAGRNLAPVHAGPREVMDVFLPPFEMALLDGGAGSVMPAYVDLDGEPLHGSRRYLTEVLRDELGFTGPVVSDYFGIEFLHRQHHVVADLAQAGRLALLAGVDVELPTGVAFRGALAEQVAGDPELQHLVDRAVSRVLTQKEALGLLDLPGEIARLEELARCLPETLDPPEHRATAARLAEESIVLLSNRGLSGAAARPGDPRGGAPARTPPDGALAGARPGEIPADTPQEDLDSSALPARSGPVWSAPVGQPTGPAVLPLVPRPGLRLAVVGPNADRAQALFGCYSFVNHVLMHHPDVPHRLEAPSLLAALRREYEPAGASVTYAVGCGVREPERDGFGAAVKVALEADVVVAVVGDQSGLFGTGTSGEGCDAASLNLPGVQADLLDALLATGRPVVVVVLSGRPYAVGALAGRAAAVVQAFFPGEAGGQAVAGVLSGRLNPSGHLPVSLPSGLPGLPYSYLHAQLVESNGVSPIDTTPPFSFGHGLSYSRFVFSDLAAAATEVATDGWVDLRVDVTNAGPQDGCCLVQLYGADPVASLVRPTHVLVGYARVALAVGATRAVRFRVPTSRFGFAGPDLHRIVEPGEIRLWLGWDADHPASGVTSIELTGPVHRLSPASPRLCDVTVDPPPNLDSSTLA